MACKEVGTTEQKWFVYQSTEKHDELKASYFHGVEKEGKAASIFGFRSMCSIGAESVS